MMPPRAHFAIERLLLLLAGCLVLAACRSEAADRPNLLLIVVDTLRAGHLGCYGYPHPTTPHIDSIAAHGILFENAVAQAAFTLPSMATLFTGLDPPRHGLRRHPGEHGPGDALGPDLLTLAEHLKARGYRTGAVVSNSLFQERFGAGFEAGFDLFDVGRRRRDAGPTTDAAVRFLEEAKNSGAPFFLWVHYIDPHWPYDPPADFERPFRHEAEGEFAALVRAFLADRVPREVLNFAPPVGPDGVAAGIAAYDSEVAYADAEIGRLIGALEGFRLEDRTAIAVVSDHGEAFGDHGLFFAHSFTLYDEIQRAVLILKPPGGRSPVRIAKQVRLLDFAATATALLGVQPFPDGDGRDLAPLWEQGEDALPETPAYAESDVWPPAVPGARYGFESGVPGKGGTGKWAMVRHMGVKLIAIPGAEDELYDLAIDPGERDNLIHRRPEQAVALGAILDEILAGAAPPSERPAAPGLDPGAVQDLRELIQGMGY